MRRTILYQDESGAWIAIVPSLPGCISDGDSPEQAIDNIADAIQTWIEHARKHGLPIPIDPLSAIVRDVEVVEH